MADPRLVSYLREQLRAGYDLNTLRNHLIQHGYDTASVDSAINSIYNIPAHSVSEARVKHEIHLSKTTMMVIAAVVVILISSVGGFLFFTKSPSSLLDLSIEIIDNAVKPGNDLQFNFEIVNLGAAKRYDVFLEYKILKQEQEITSKEETIAVETRTSARSRIRIPENLEPGNYILRATAKYDGKVAIASESFKVFEQTVEATCFDNIKNQDEEEIDCGGVCDACKKCPASCNDNNKCTEDYCSKQTGFECRNDPITPCCGNNRCESGEEGTCLADCPVEQPVIPIPPVDQGELSGLSTWEKLEEIKKLAETNPEKAAGLCLEIENPSHKDKCFTNIAEVTLSQSACEQIESSRSKDQCLSAVADKLNDYSICEKISIDDRKDSCYMNFVMRGNYELCDKLFNEYLKESCSVLKNIQENPEQFQTT